VLLLSDKTDCKMLVFSLKLGMGVIFFREIFRTTRGGKSVKFHFSATTEQKSQNP